MKHSSIVGGSTAKRVINCPGSVAASAKMPPKPSSKFADEGTLLHNCIAEALDKDMPPEMLVGTRYQQQYLTQDLIDNKLRPALDALDAIDSDGALEFAVEQNVTFESILPGVFGSADIIGRMGDRAIVLDWKFGDGVTVEAEESEQLMFYAAAAMRTPGLEWVFEGATAVELIIVQPPMTKRWVTSFDRIRQFERELIHAVRAAQKPNASLYAGDHCRWCAAKPTCPQITGEVSRALDTQIKALDPVMLGAALSRADLLEQWIADLRGLASQVIEHGGDIPGHKLVAKRASRQWKHEDEAKAALLMLLPETELVESALRSPAQIEKLLKKQKLGMPQELVVSVSSGSTLVREDDSRPAVLQIGKQLAAALSLLN